MMRLRHIEIFEAIRRTGSITDAASALHISQPAASKLLANAEAQLGFPLFERIKGRLQATQEAEVLAPQISRLYLELTQVRRLADNLRQGLHGHLRIGANPAFGLGLIPEVAREMLDAMPEVTIDINTYHRGELIEGLLTRSLDLVVTFDTADPPGIARQQIGQTELVHIAAARRRGPYPLSEMDGQPFIAPDARDPAGAILQHAFDDAGVAPRIVAQVQTHAVAVAMVEFGCGQTVVDMLTAKAMLRPGMTISRLDPAIVVPVSVMQHGSTPASALHRDFIARLARACSRQALAPDQHNLSA